MKFNDFFTSLTETNVSLSSLVDLQKVKTNVENISIHLNQLNYLIGEEDLNKAIIDLYAINPKCFSVLNILVAVRKNNKRIFNEKDFSTSEINSYFNSSEKIIEFFKKTCLEDVFKNINIKNLVDYVFGVEVGLDRNARKNRNGKTMELAVSDYFVKNSIDFETQVQSSSLDGLEVLGVDKKVFDFVVKTPVKTYLIEANFYNDGGSKLNEVARAYTDIAPKINSVENFEFIWITDGFGWHKAKNKLEEAFSKIDKVYNLNTLVDFIGIVKKPSKIK